MDFVLLGGDERFACLTRLLEGQGFSALRLWAGDAGEPLELLAGARNVVLNWPLRLRRGPDIGAVLARVPRDATLWLCGPGTPESLPGERRWVNLWADEALLVENAEFTAEGAVSAAMSAGRRSLRELPALLIGWGRIGRALTERLTALGVPVRVASRKEAHRRQAAARGAETADTACLGAALPGRKLVFNTAPEPLLDAGTLAQADGDAMIIDLASAPCGVDLSAAWARGLRAWREPGLPGRYCPESAAGALAKAMARKNWGRDARW